MHIQNISFTELVNLTVSFSQKVENCSPHEITSEWWEPLENQSKMHTCGQFTPLLAHLLHSVSQWACFITNIFQQRHYRGRQLVLSGQLCPFISLLGTAVIKRNEETGSNNAAKNHSSISFTSFLQLFSACFCFCYFHSLYFHPPAYVSLYIYTSKSLCFPSSSLRRQHSRGICKSLLLRKLHPTLLTGENVRVPVGLSVPQVPQKRLRKSTEKIRLVYCQKIFWCQKNKRISAGHHVNMVCQCLSKQHECLIVEEYGYF